jgi:sugar (pentulose or hexulose) kinase
VSRAEAVIGLDVGTTRIKGLLLGLDGVALAEAERLTPWVTDAAGTHADAAGLAAAARDVVARAAEAPEGERARVVGIGVTGMGEAGVLLDGAGGPLAPVLAWHDRRGDVEAIRAAVGEEAFGRHVGMVLDSQPSLPKILWLRREVPDARRAVRFCSVPEWVVVCLGGQPVSELSLASRTGLLDLGTAAPWSAARELIGGDLLNDVVQAGSPAGVADGTAPEAVRGATLTIAGHDHQAAALAVGAARDGALLDSLGTAEALVRCVRGPLGTDTVARLVGGRITVGWGVVPGHWSVLLGLRSGMVLEQLAAVLGAFDRDARLELGRLALEVAAAAGAGTRPVLHEFDGQTYLGPLASGLSPAGVWAAAVEDLIAASDRGAALIAAEVGPHTDVVLSGGWSRNPAVAEAKRRQFPRVRTSELGEAGAVGAAYLAAVAAGFAAVPDGGGPPSWPARPTLHLIPHGEER